MRITGGTARSRKLTCPGSSRNNAIRPTTDRVREALFSILNEYVAGAAVLDLFAGTGALGLEALSRGAACAVFVDRSPGALELIRMNLHLCFEQPPATVMRLDLDKNSAFQALGNKFSGNHPFDIIFLDPPYEKKLAEKTLLMVEKTGLAAAGGRIIAEERWSEELPETIGRLRLWKKRRYGETGIRIYRPAT